ncbi:4a-hydroxytetrahydrobiopterin dehydratase [Kluyveromyces lactis]|uniref:4a-hydroxytetrahydrobiopterin dehydratase n=1 Tax=Kluyveromyces lactis (strain ATCC 8585 / CBS 2359 / DSM 70799 / NBRC 1267 / NRRL Y-1140 / WM37) TaxID=284590 RepID=Q6CIM5_KLULA|nr:uncharacterized protein KLLA0_F25454g [Kluyveromyces lactis]CAG98922.1 KLLA0F25454p [Kluyveromyces lactis]|eukprot:XP_456214.1 uncharacterized protein KLLA0_F25454g [Kluyveromyces lactis]
MALKVFVQSTFDKMVLLVFCFFSIFLVNKDFLHLGILSTTHREMLEKVINATLQALNSIDMYNKIVKQVPVLLPPKLLTQELRKLPKWRLMENELVRDYKFRDFEETWSFLNKVAMRSHLWGHHPTITTTYNRVQFRLTTHDVSGISDADIMMASRIEKYIKQIDPKKGILIGDK